MGLADDGFELPQSLTSVRRAHSFLACRGLRHFGTARSRGCLLDKVVTWYKQHFQGSCGARGAVAVVGCAECRPMAAELYILIVIEELHRLTKPQQEIDLCIRPCT